MRFGRALESRGFFFLLVVVMVTFLKLGLHVKAFVLEVTAGLSLRENVLCCGVIYIYIYLSGRLRSRLALCF